MQEESFSEKQSLSVIEEMISTAKQEQTGAGYYLVLWGIIVFCYCIAMFISLYYKLPWLSFSWILFLAGGLLSILRSRKDSREEKARSLADRLYLYVWSGVWFSIFVVLNFTDRLGGENILPLILLMYALASYVTGGATKYWPSVYGALLCAVCCIFAFCVSEAYQLLICAAASVFVHVIPGLMMKNYYKRRLNA